ncbi:lef-8 [Hyphantria cunea granulovirus]|uniref:Lef-8 n=1 Tax=Hyphantria cunea granulovirus TaxID=307448 RepID=A0AAF1D2B2_9BBAC|nr:lef-8 [Hyphantria cunea granulovirus]QBQ01664.1 lef-8 [Hyphantria cunea granulovirus]
MGVIQDFNTLYNYLQSTFNLTFRLSCQASAQTSINLKTLQERYTYFCCALNEEHQKCVLHNCVVVIIGTWLDKQFRDNEEDRGFTGTFIIDGRHFSFPNILMNNNILLHNFFDKQYPRNTNLRRIFLYGNFDDEKIINRAIQLVYDRAQDVLYVRDVYAKDYVVDSGINKVLQQYLKCSGKWDDMDFVFDHENYNDLFQRLKQIMRTDIDYQIDSLSNKIIYKHAYLLKLTYDNVLNKINVDEWSKKRKNNVGILYPGESKKCYDTIVAGKLIQSVSRTLSKHKKFDQDYNSNNNNLEIYPLCHRIGNEVLRIVNENLQQDMLKHTSDYVKFVDSFFHGEMTVAGKKFFLCHNTTLPDVNYKHVNELFHLLINKKLLFNNKTNDTCENCDQDFNCNSDPAEKSFFKNYNLHNIEPKIKTKDPTRKLLVSFNNRPTIFWCTQSNVCRIYYYVKRNMSPVEVKMNDNTLFLNHHEGMIMLRKVVEIDKEIKINTLQTPFEYHNEKSVVNMLSVLEFCDNDDDIVSLTSTIVQNYYKNYLHIFYSIPLPKLIVSLTNLKNGMVVQTPLKLKSLDYLPLGTSVTVSPSMMCNDRMFYLWTLVRDNKLKTAEDPYIPHHTLPIRVYHNKMHRLKGKTDGGDVVYKAAPVNQCIIDVEGGNSLCLFGVVVSTNKINWNHDGKKYKIEYCTSKMHHVYKVYMYFRKVKGQEIEKIESELLYDEGHVQLKIVLICSVADLEGLKICGIHGQKGVLSEPEDLSMFFADDDSTVHAQICLSPISFLSRQTNFDYIPKKICTRGEKKYPLFLIPYMFFNNTPDNIYKEFLGKNITGHEKVEGTRLDQWSINQSLIGKHLAEGLHCVRNGHNLLDNCGQYNVFKSLLHCNNIHISDD